VVRLVLVVTGDSLTQRPIRSLRCFLTEATWQINEQNYKTAYLQINNCNEFQNSEAISPKNWYIDN